jgi:hypothetical protein
MAFNFRNWCTPAYFYFVISMIAIVIMLIQNFGNTNLYCLGDYSCNVTSKSIIFVIKFLYVLFWTWVLDLICKNGFESLSWFLVLLPFVVMFITIGYTFFI